MTAPPPPGSLSITFADEAMVLLASRALWWPACSSLVIADLHLGKAASFRMHGIPVPEGGGARDLSRLSTLLHATGAERLIILGDLLHARAARQPEILDEMTAWRSLHSQLNILLIRGNHDRSAGHAPSEWRLQEVEEPFANRGLVLLHDPARPTVLPALAGHIHPVTSLRDFDGSTVSIPTFIQDPDRLILPSFGAFTGGYKMSAKLHRRIYLVMSGRVIASRA